ncbi:MAG: tetratricopeptide repeat protein [Verrucomicrobia bacterium]|nr:tetratricopeptide repeat protein [Verrucomicrobiota bacterium]
MRRGWFNALLAAGTVACAHAAPTAGPVQPPTQPATPPIPAVQLPPPLALPSVAPRPAPEAPPAAAPTMPAAPLSTNAPVGTLTNAVPLDPAVAQLDFANGLYMRQFFDMALVEYIRFTQKFDTHPLADEVYYRMGECQRQLKQTEEARKSFLAVTRRWPGSEHAARAHFRLGEAALDAKQTQQAATMFLAAAHQTQDDQVRATSQFYLAKAQLELGQAAQAMENFERVLKAKEAAPFHPYAEAIVAGLWLRRGDHRQALTHYENVVALNAPPELREEALYETGALRYALKFYPDAAKAFRLFLKDFPKSRWVTDAAVGLAHSLYASGKNHEAAEVGRQWYGVAPKQARAELALMVAGSMRDDKAYREAADWFAKAGSAAGFAEEVRCAFLGGDFPRAVARGEALIQGDPKNPFLESVMMVVAESLEAQKLWARSAAAYRALVDKFPQTKWAADALWHAATCWQQVPKLDEAVKDFDRVVNQFRDDSRTEAAMYQIGACYGQLDKQTDMVTAFSKLLTAFPRGTYTAEACYWVGADEIAREKWAEGTGNIERALELRPADNRKRASGKLVVAYYKLDKPEKAADHVQALVERGEAKLIAPEIFAWLGEKLLAAGKTQEAIPHLLRALEAKIEPELRAKINESLARVHRALGQWDKAAAYNRDVLETDDKGQRGLGAAVGLSEALVRSGDYKEAQETLERLIEQHPEGPENARIRMLLGDLYVGLKQYRDAGRFYMSVAVLYDDPKVTPEALDRAAAAFDACNREGDAAQARRELAQRYPDYKKLQLDPNAGLSKPVPVTTNAPAGGGAPEKQTPKPEPSKP